MDVADGMLVSFLTGSWNASKICSIWNAKKAEIVRMNADEILESY